MLVDKILFVENIYFSYEIQIIFLCHKYLYDCNSNLIEIIYKFKREL